MIDDDASSGDKFYKNKNVDKVKNFIIKYN
jgi:hypothetical protein